jgi:hypothetical protein
VETADTEISGMISLAQTIVVVNCEDLEFTDGTDSKETK